MNPLSHTHSIRVDLPIWIGEFESSLNDVFPTIESRMLLAVELAAKNVSHESGGPFGAAVFDLDTGELVSLGINLVVDSGYSIAHAEILALAFAQNILGTHDVSKSARPHLQLVTSVEPCSMCLGAIPWSGVKSVVCGARTSDAEAVGFDEGPKLDSWPQELEKRGIAVRRDIEREAAIKPLQNYLQSGGAIYNGGGK